MDSGYIESWAQRVLANAPKDETVGEVLACMRGQAYMNRGRWAAYCVRLGEAIRRREGGQAMSAKKGETITPLNVFCDFCGHTGKDCGRLVRGVFGVHICEGCARDVVRLFEDEKEETDADDNA